MNVFHVKYGYVCFIVFLYGLSTYGALKFSTNLFAECGATIVVVSIFRGINTVKNLDWSANEIVKLASIGQRVSLKWDAVAASLGTATNGFSAWLYKLAVLFI